MDDCVFCKIVRGELPSHKVYEDKDFLGFMDINPLAPGQVQIIPKKHYRWVWDVPNPGEYFEAAAKIANAQRKAFGEMVTAKIIGDEVHHAHIWLIPDKNNKAELKDLAGNAEKIKKNL